MRDKAHGLIGPGLGRLVASSDLLQETLLIAVKKFAAISGRPRRQVLLWLNRIMRYRLLRYLRTHQHELRGGVENFAGAGPPAGSDSALGRLVVEELRGEVSAAIDALPEPERTVMLAHYKERRTISEIARTLGRTEGAVRAIHQRAVKRLRRNLEGRFP